jgi:FMN phosphatase YigB (HAD superfamily)
MNPFFQKKLFLLDVDHTIIDWKQLQTMWDFRKDIVRKLTLTERAVHLRGGQSASLGSHHLSPVQATDLHTVPEFITVILQEIEQTNHWLGIFSDFPQPLLRSTFSTLKIHHIVSGTDIGCLKPLPDGCLQLMAMLGVCGSETHLIGDGCRTDARAITQAGGHFIPIQQLRGQPDLLRKWLQ